MPKQPFLDLSAIKAELYNYDKSPTSKDSPGAVLPGKLERTNQKVSVGDRNETILTMSDKAWKDEEVSWRGRMEAKIQVLAQDINRIKDHLGQQ